jgi:RHS repeat-associated protein
MEVSGSVYAWEYYLLGGMNEQFAVYQGVQMKDNSFRAWNSCTTYSTQNKPEQNQESFVYLYPVEYNIYGLGSSPLLSYRRMGMTGQWKKHLNIPDYIGNVRMVLREGVTPDTWTILDSYNYTAYGKSIFDDESLTPIEHSKRKFIGKQTDEESLLSDHGVRKYDKVLGQFTCPDPLWEKYYSWTPYQYCLDNPVMLKDDNGLLPGDPFKSPAQAAHDFGKNYNALSFAINGEISTSIYQYKATDGKIKYTYAIPNAVAVDGSNPSDSEIDKDGYEKVAEAHTHGPKNNEKENEDNFSPGDKQNREFNLFLVSPGGYLKLFKVDGTESTITKDMPIDPKSKRKSWQMVDGNPDKRKLPIYVPYPSNGSPIKLEDARTQLSRE